MAGAPSWLKGAQSETTRSSEPRGVLFVCTGNICRSAFADMYLRDRLRALGGVGVPVSSAGIMAVVGHDLDSQMAAEARAIGLSGSGHSARQLTGRILRDAALVVVFGPEHVEWIASEFPEHLVRTVALGQAASALRHSAARVPLREVAGEVQSADPDPSDSEWIADPYRRGPEAARVAAQRIRSDVGILLDTISWPV